MPNSYYDYYTVLEAVRAAGDASTVFATARIGETGEVCEPADIRYPQWFVECDPLVTLESQTVRYDLAVLALDRIEEGYADKVEAARRMEFAYQAALREITLADEGLVGEGDLFDAVAVPVFEGYADRVVGWRVEFSVEVPRNRSVCDLPYA